MDGLFLFPLARGETGSKGEMSLAQRHLPLRPLPETWGRFDLAPTPPNDTKGRGCGPSPLDSPPGSGERQRKEKQFHSLTTPKASQYSQMRGSNSLFRQGIAHPVGDYQITRAPATTTKGFAQKGANGAGFAHKRFLFGP